MFNMVRQHTKLSSETSIRSRTRASNDDFLTFHKSALMRRTLSSDFLALKSIEFNETLRVAKYYKYLCVNVTFSIYQKNQEISNKESQKEIQHYGTKPAPDTSAPVLLFESKSIRNLLYESLCSTWCVSTPNCLLKPQFEVVHVPQMMIS